MFHPDATALLTLEHIDERQHRHHTPRRRTDADID